MDTAGTAQGDLVASSASEGHSVQPGQVATASGVGVIDKAVLILDALALGPKNLSALVAATSLPRPTAHRLAGALVQHRLADRNRHGDYILGAKIGALANTTGTDRMTTLAVGILDEIRDHTGESAQLYRRQGDQRICVAASEKSSGLRDTVPVGAILSMHAGSAAQVLLAWAEPEEIQVGLDHARFSAASLGNVRRRGWAQSVGEREAGVASVSAPVRGNDKSVVAAISISGPIDRLTRTPGKLYAKELVRAARELSDRLRHTS